MDVWVESAGLGHVTRQLNLAHALRDTAEGIAIRFFTDGNPAIVQRLEASGEQFRITEKQIELAVSDIQQAWAQDPPRIFLLDSATLHGDATVRRLLTNAPGRTVCLVDEIRSTGVVADLVINALPGGEVSSSNGKVLRGAEFLIQDLDVAKFHDMWKSTPARAEKGFAFFGGMDGNDFSSVFVEAIARSNSRIAWKLLVGPMYREFDRLSARIAGLGLQVQVEREVKSVASELWESHLVVIAGGNTLSEAVGVGTPCLCLAQTDEQSHNARYFGEASGAVFVGAAGETFPYPTSQPAILFRDPEHAVDLLSSALDQLAGDQARRSQVRRRMLGLMDGRGASRVAAILLDMINP